MNVRRLGCPGIVIAAALLSGCGGEESQRAPEPTEHQRDSVIAESRLPGASGVGAALRAQDRATAANARVDSIAASVP